MVNFGTLSTLFLSLFIGNGNVSEVNNTNSSPLEVVSSQSESVLIDDFTDESKIYNWWDSNPENWARKWEKDQEMLVVTCKSVGKDYDTFGKQFEPIDFSLTPALKVRMKYDGDEAPQVRIDIKDYDGKVTNAKPIVKTIGKELKDYYYNYSGKFAQSWPDADEVDPIEIVELLVFINPGKKDFTGTLFLDKIEAIPASECKE